VLRLTVSILLFCWALGGASSAQAARPMSEYYAMLGLEEGASSQSVDSAFLSKLQFAGSADQARSFQHLLESQLIRGASIQNLHAHATTLGLDLAAQAVEAFVMIRAGELSARDRGAIDLDRVAASFESMRSLGVAESRAAEAQSSRRSRWSQGLALILAFGASKLMLENVFHLANATGSRTWLAASIATTVLYLYLPRLYVQNPEVKFGAFSAWMLAAYRRALVSSVVSTVAVGGCVKLLRAAF
jgi:hypothetical protein